MLPPDTPPLDRRVIAGIAPAAAAVVAAAAARIAVAAAAAAAGTESCLPLPASEQTDSGWIVKWHRHHVNAERPAMG